MTSVAFSVDHVSTVEPPAEIVDGFAVNEMIAGAGGGGVGETVTVAVAVALPPGPVAVNVYDVLSVGFTMTLPDTGKLPVTPEIVTEVALVVAQVNVTFAPITMVVGFAVKLVMVGTGVVTPPPGGGVFAPPLAPHEIKPKLETTTTEIATRRDVARIKAPI